MRRAVVTASAIMVLAAALGGATLGGGGGAGLTDDQVNGPVSAFGIPQVTQDTPVTQQHFTYGITLALTLDGSDVLSVNINPTVPQNQADVTLVGHEIQ